MSKPKKSKVRNIQPTIQATNELNQAIADVFTKEIAPISYTPKVGDVIKVCDKARFLAIQAEQERANEAASREQAFMDSLFPDRSQYVNHGDHTYTICGYRWRYYVSMGIERLFFDKRHPDNLWKGIWILQRNDEAATLTEFGAILLQIDERLKDLALAYPDHLGGKIGRWLCRWMEKE